MDCNKLKKSKITSMKLMLFSFCKHFRRMHYVMGLQLLSKNVENTKKKGFNPLFTTDRCNRKKLAEFMCFGRDISVYLYRNQREGYPHMPNAREKNKKKICKPLIFVVYLSR